MGNTTSNAATLTVTAAATLILNASQTALNFSSVNIGSNSILPVIFTNGGNSNVTISNVTVSGAGYTASGVSSGQIVTSGTNRDAECHVRAGGDGTPPGKRHGNQQRHQFPGVDYAVRDRRPAGIALGHADVDGEHVRRCPATTCTGPR